jgi:ribonuclease P protein component
LRQPKLTSEGDFAPLREPVQTCIGISIGLKVSKRAVVRNRIKRRIRSAMQELLPHLALGWQIVIVVKPSATQCSYEQFLQELKQLLVSAEVIINEH